jgi:hypothetical protein
MDAKNMKDWLKAVDDDLVELGRLEFGYPLGVNEVREPLPIKASGIPSFLDQIYNAFDGLSLPDIHIGYFIDSASRTASAPERGEPSFIVCDTELPIHVFGSDGGGGRFAVGLSDGAIYYLPSSGSVRDGKYIADCASKVRRLSSNVSGFLDLLRKDIHAFVQDEKGHRFMVG